MGQFHDQLASRTERCEALERELDSTKKERDECVAALRATAMSLATAQSDLASERAANEELRRQMSEMLRDHQEWKGAMARNDAEMAEMRATTAREKEVAIQRECKRIVDDLKRELRDTKKRAATEKAKMAGELKQATAMRDAHAAQTEMLLVERNKLGDELMRVRTKAKLAGKAKAANPGLTPSPAPGCRVQERAEVRARGGRGQVRGGRPRRQRRALPVYAQPGGCVSGGRRRHRAKEIAPNPRARSPRDHADPTNPADRRRRHRVQADGSRAGLHPRRGREGEGVEQKHRSIRVGRRKRTRRLVERVTRRITGECAEGDDARRDA